MIGAGTVILTALLVVVCKGPGAVLRAAAGLATVVGLIWLVVTWEQQAQKQSLRDAIQHSKANHEFVPPEAVEASK